jgi:hypothetical protein
MKTNGVAFNEEGRESEKKGEQKLKILDVDFFFLLPARLRDQPRTLVLAGDDRVSLNISLVYARNQLL